MWVFGYGSLMWDGWEIERSCMRRVVADLLGYRRVFNKASVSNWGTKSHPCPTLNLSRQDGGTCRGIAFEFPDRSKEQLLAYLITREGKGFSFREMPVRLDGNNTVLSMVPVYEGNNLIDNTTVEAAVSLLIAAIGTKGSCFAYVKGIAEKLLELGIDDPTVAEFWSAAKAQSQIAVEISDQTAGAQTPK